MRWFRQPRAHDVPSPSSRRISVLSEGAERAASGRAPSCHRMRLRSPQRVERRIQPLQGLQPSWRTPHHAVRCTGRHFDFDMRCIKHLDLSSFHALARHVQACDWVTNSIQEMLTRPQFTISDHALNARLRLAPCKARLQPEEPKTQVSRLKPQAPHALSASCLKRPMPQAPHALKSPMPLRASGDPRT